jgi:hypothetical protein
MYNTINTFFEITIIKSFRKQKKKSKKKIYFLSSFENLIVTSKVIRRRQHINIDSKGILKQSESEEAPNRQEVMGPISIQVS